MVASEPVAALRFGLLGSAKKICGQPANVFAKLILSDFLGGYSSNVQIHYKYAINTAHICPGEEYMLRGASLEGNIGVKSR